MLELLSIGGITFDNLFWVNRLPRVHFEGIIEKQGKFFGGRAPNVAVAVSKLGIKTGLVSAVGKDFESEGYADYLRARAIDLRGVVIVPNSKTKQIFIFTDPNGDQITFFDYGAERYFKEMEIPHDLILESRSVHISSSGDYTFNRRCAEFAHDKGVIVSFDPGNDPFTEIKDYLNAMLHNCDILFVNNEEAKSMLKQLELREAKDLLDFGPKIAVIIDKKDKSSILYTQDKTEHIPSAIRMAIDPTGASDGYVAGFITGYLKGYDLKSSGNIGAIEASFVAEDFGAQTNLPDWQSLCKRGRERLVEFECRP